MHASPAVHMLISSENRSPSAPAETWQSCCSCRRPKRRRSSSASPTGRRLSTGCGSSSASHPSRCSAPRPNVGEVEAPFLSSSALCSGGHADRRPARLVGGRRPRDPHEHPPRPPRPSRHAASDSPSRAFSRGAAPSHCHCAPRAAAAAAAAARPRAARDHGVGGVRGRGGLRIKERSTRSTLDAPCRRRAGRRLRRVRSCSSSRGGQFCQIRVRNSIR